MRQIYIAIGGSETLGDTGATVVRLVLSALVLGAPTFLMGGSLPAVARAVTRADDTRRSRLAILYGVNTLGAVTGVMLATFLLLEVLGSRQTLWVACLVNLLIAVVAHVLDRNLGKQGERAPDLAETSRSPQTRSKDAAPPGLVVAAAALVGFAFFFMELVWYRMLSPLLGGSVFTFGLILAVALFGIGLGGAAYAVLGKKRQATLFGFSITCLLEATAIGLAFALGDRIALLAAQLRSLEVFGFGGLVVSWVVVTAVVVLPASSIAGIQLPLLINLLGRGAAGVGRQVGLVYTFNTAGAVVGSLAGGFGLMSVLGAVASWRLVVLILVALGVTCAAIAIVRARPRFAVAVPAGLAAAATLMILAQGPTSYWRHSSIGAGRVSMLSADENRTEDVLRRSRRKVIWEVEGIESSIAALGGNGLALLVNGKSDGNAINDGPTMVMTGLIGALLHPGVRNAAVVGLGTGATSGWLAEVESIDRVDTIELERAVLRFAEAAKAVNHDVTSHPKSVITVGDARERFLVSRQNYDLIVSQPSNPFRAGIASLLTREFYQAVERRLADGGLFLQWVQAYEVDAMTIRIVYATLAAVFPHVETWQTMGSDLLFVCSREPLEYDIEKLQVTTAAEPYRTALETVWGVKGVEGLLSRFVASAELARVIASEETGLNTDDLMTIEFAFARTVGASGGFSIEHIRDMGALRGLSRPQVTNGEVDWRLVEEQRLSLYSTVPRRLPQNAARLLHPNRRSLVTAHNLFVQGRLPSAWEALQRIDREPIGLQELRIAAIGAVMARDPADEQWIEALDEIQPTEALIIRARRAVMREEHELAVGLLVDAFTRSRTDPWTSQQLLRVALRDATSLAASSEDHALRLYDSLTASFAAGLLDDARKQSLLEIGAVLERTDPSRCVEILALFEPNVPWSFEHLMNRVACYQANSHPLLERAEVDADRFLSRISMPFDLGALREPSPQQPIFDEMSMSPVGPASADQGMRDSE